MLILLLARSAACVRVLIVEARALRLALEELDLPLELLGERLVQLPVALPVGIPPETAAAVAVVVPARIVENRIQADPLDRHALPPRLPHLLGEPAQPAGARLVLGAGLGHHQRPAVTLPGLAQDRPERTVAGIVPRQRGPVEDPLVVRVVVDPDDVEVPLVAAELRPELARDHVPGLELGLPVPLGEGPVLGAGPHDVDDRIAVEDARPGIDAPQGVDRRETLPHELCLELEPPARGGRIEVADLTAGPR